MSNSNENNRPQIGRDLGAVTASKSIMLVHARKRMIMRQAALLLLADLGADGVNYIELQLQKVTQAGVETLIGAKVDTSAGLTKYNPLEIELGSTEGLDLAAGESVNLVITKVGTGALADAHIAMDTLIKGN